MECIIVSYIVLKKKIRGYQNLLSLAFVKSCFEKKKPSEVLFSLRQYLIFSNDDNKFFTEFSFSNSLENEVFTPHYNETFCGDEDFSILIENNFNISDLDLRVFVSKTAYIP